MKMRDLPSWSQTHFDYFMDAVRIYLGIGLLIKGISFATNPNYFASTFNGFAFDRLLPIVPYVHIFAGIFLAAGIFTRVAAIVQIPILFAAVFLVHLPQMETIRGRESIEFSALVLFLLVLIAFKGSGSLTLARYWRKEAAPQHHWIAEHPDVFADLVRIYLGIGLFAKGLYIMEHREAFLGFVAGSPNIPMFMTTAAHYVIPAHFVGGVLLGIGLLTRIAALAQLPPLLGAIFYAFLPTFSMLEMRQSLEFTALVTFLFALIGVFGPGRLSVENSGRKLESINPTLQPAH